MNETETETSRKRGRCDECGRLVSLKKDGTLRHHQKWVGGAVQFPPICDGRVPSKKWAAS